MNQLPYRLERNLTIQASPETVFRFFTDTPRWAAWWGAGSSIEPRPGGAMRIRHPNGVEVSGDVVELQTPEKIAFTYGYVSGQGIPPGGSLVTIRLEAQGAGTRLHLVHDFADESMRDQHVQGWRFQLSLFSNLVANEVYAGAATLVDAWFAFWSEPDDAARAAAIARLAAQDVRFQDSYSALEGAADLCAHVAASRRFMPGISLERRGDVRQCQGTALADWVARSADGREQSTGTSVFRLTSDARIESVTSVRNPPPK